MEIKKLRVLVKAKIGVLPPIPFPMPQPEVCESALKCPLVVGNPVTFTALVSVLPEYPSVRRGHLTAATVHFTSLH